MYWNKEGEHVNFYYQKSFQQPITQAFQRKYAKVVLELEDLNKELNDCLIDVQKYCQEVGVCLSV